MAKAAVRSKVIVLRMLKHCFFVAHIVGVLCLFVVLLFNTLCHF